ncbi:MAG: UPF0175 family protein [Candidatus Helarchaeota archaeon]
MLPDDLKKEIDYLKQILKEDQSSLIRRLLWKSIESEKIEFAVKLYLEEKISLGKAAEIANISIWQMLDELHKRNLPLKYKLSDAELEIHKMLEKHQIPLNTPSIYSPPNSSPPQKRLH